MVLARHAREKYARRKSRPSTRCASAGYMLTIALSAVAATPLPPAGDEWHALFLTPLEPPSSWCVAPRDMLLMTNLFSRDAICDECEPQASKALALIYARQAARGQKALRTIHTPTMIRCLCGQSAGFWLDQFMAGLTNESFYCMCAAGLEPRLLAETRNLECPPPPTPPTWDPLHSWPLDAATNPMHSWSLDSAWPA